VSTFSVGRSVLTFFLPKTCPIFTTFAVNFVSPKASATTYAFCPTFTLATSVSSKSTRTRKAETSAIVTIPFGLSGEIVSPSCRRFRKIIPVIGDFTMVLVRFASVVLTRVSASRICESNSLICVSASRIAASALSKSSFLASELTTLNFA
jgi:hypothetical protein